MPTFSVYFTTLDDMVRQLKTAAAAGWLTSKLGSTSGPACSWSMTSAVRHEALMDLAEGGVRRRSSQ